MKSTFSTQLPPTPRPSTRRSDEQDGTVRYGKGDGRMTARATGNDRPLPRRIPARIITGYRSVVLDDRRGVAFPFPRPARSVRGAGRRPVFRSVTPSRFPFFLPVRLPYSAAFSTLPCLAASMSWRVRKPIAWPQSRQTSW